ncbi:hypothetical protein WDV93_11090 [Pantoea ananatis]
MPTITLSAEADLQQALVKAGAGAFTWSGSHHDWFECRVAER